MSKYETTDEDFIQAWEEAERAAIVKKRQEERARRKEELAHYVVQYEEEFGRESLLRLIGDK